MTKAELIDAFLNHPSMRVFHDDGTVIAKFVPITEAETRELEDLEQRSMDEAIDAEEAAHAAAKGRKHMDDAVAKSIELDALAAEARGLAANTGVIKTQEGRHILNLITRIAEAASRGKPMTPPISTHNA